MGIHRATRRQPPEDARGFARTIHRVAGWCAVVYALVNPVALVLRAEYAEPPLTHGETLTLVVCSGLALVGALWFLARPTLDAALPWLGRRGGTVDGLQLVFFVAVISAMTVAAGGTGSWQWLFLVFVIVLAAVSLSFAWTSALGLLSVVGFLGAAALTDTLGPEHAYLNLTAVLAIALLSVFAALLARALRLAREQVDEQRTQLAQEVDGLTQALGQLARGDLAGAANLTSAAAQADDHSVVEVWTSLDTALTAMRGLVGRVHTQVTSWPPTCTDCTALPPVRPSGTPSSRLPSPRPARACKSSHRPLTRSPRRRARCPPRPQR